MIKSIRRISGALLLLGIGLLVLNFLVPNSANLKSSGLAAFLPLALEPDVANQTSPQSTVKLSLNPESTMRRWIPREVIRLTSSHIFFLGFLSIIVLEFFEIHYLKSLLPHRRRKFRT